MCACVIRLCLTHLILCCAAWRYQRLSATWGHCGSGWALQWAICTRRYTHRGKQRSFWDTARFDAIVALGGTSCLSASKQMLSYRNRNWTSRGNSWDQKETETWRLWRSDSSRHHTHARTRTRTQTHTLNSTKLEFSLAVCAGAHWGAEHPDVRSPLWQRKTKRRRRGRRKRRRDSSVPPQAVAGQRPGAAAGPVEDGAMEGADCHSSVLQVRGGVDCGTGEVGTEPWSAHGIKTTTAKIYIEKKICANCKLTVCVSSEWIREVVEHCSAHCWWWPVVPKQLKIFWMIILNFSKC